MQVNSPLYLHYSLFEVRILSLGDAVVNELDHAILAFGGVSTLYSKPALSAVCPKPFTGALAHSDTPHKALQCRLSHQHKSVPSPFYAKPPTHICSFFAGRGGMRCCSARGTSCGSRPCRLCQLHCSCRTLLTMPPRSPWLRRPSALRRSPPWRLPLELPQDHSSRLCLRV